MSKQYETITSRLVSKIIFIFLCAVILTHFIAFILYAQNNKRAEAKVNREIMAAQVLDIIGKIKYAAPQDQQTVVSNVDIPDVSVSIDANPRFKIKLPITMSLYTMGKHFELDKPTINASIQMSANKWLNISALIAQTTWHYQLFFLILEIVIVVAVFFSIWSINRFAIPLKQFREAAERLGIDIEQPPLAIYGPAIVRETADAMNKLQGRIRDLIRERTLMLAALSHDLRTPITRMKLRAHFISDQDLIQKTLHDLDEMEQMISETLNFAKNQNIIDNKIKFDLNSLLATIESEFKDINKKVSYSGPEHRLLLYGRPVALKRAFNNLIENALKYAGSAEIKVHEKKQNIIVYIDDQGPGIPEDLLETVFAPFYRAENSRSRQTGGVGLGLAVTRDIIRAHGGSIKLMLRPKGGLRVLVKLPYGTE